jgi:uncharacterized protein (TIGR02246 family)
MGCDDDVRAIEAILQRLTAAENAGDPTVFEEVLAEDAVILPPACPAVVGKAACLAFIRGVLADILEHFDRRRPISYVSAEVRISGDLAFTRGTFSQTLAPKDGGALIDEQGKYVELFARGPDGSWKVSRAIWNLDGSERE